MTKIKRSFIIVVTIAVYLQQARANPLSHILDAPIARGPGISQEVVEAIASAEGRLTVSDFLDRNRPEKTVRDRLRSLLERAQSAWLSGVKSSARERFQEIADLALKADWLEPQREAIHYAFLRLAQLATSLDEQRLWLKKAVQAFPDIYADPSLFPPPLMEAFQDTRKDILAKADSYSPSRHFPEARYVLINGKRFSMSPDLHIRLPDGSYRITILSDLHKPMTAVLSRQKMETIRYEPQTLAAGNCETPSGPELFEGLSQLTVLYAIGCMRTRTAEFWLPNHTLPNHIDEVSKPNRENPLPEFLLKSPPRSSASLEKKHWLWAGVIALGAGAAYIAYRELSRNHQPEATVMIKPIERNDF